MRGQAIISFVISAVLFLFLVVYIVNSVMDSVNPVLLQAQEDERKVVAASVLSLLTTQEGAWTGGGNWEAHTDGVTRLGLASSYMILSEKKIAALEGLEAEEIRTLLGEDHNYAICIGEDCILADVRTSDFVIPEEKFAEGIFATKGGKEVGVRVSVQ